ncbi:MAG: IPT/TIG domain-containing protein [Solirubrobacteraceae bacterium]
MELRARIRPHLRRASFAAASVALLASATAGLAASDAHAKPKKKKAPRITAIAPKHVAVGQTLTIRGRNFLVGRSKNTVVFKRKGARAVFAKADVSTKKVLRVKVPATLQKFFALKAGNPVPTVFRLRILAARFGKRFTGPKLSPIVSGPVPTANQVVQSPDGDCDKDGVKNRIDADDDNDLLTDATEVAIGTVPCNADSDGDGVEDGYEFQSAKDLNDDEHQNPNQNLPYPGKRPYPNPLYADAGRDYDGDALTLANEQALWRYSYAVSHMATRTLTRLSYSDGMQYSLFSYESGDHGRRHPAQPFSTYPMQARFLSWASTHGYGQVRISTGGTYDAPVGGVNGLYDIRDVDLSGGPLSASEVNPADDGDGWVSDDERDEDADGLSNYLEYRGPLSGVGYWSGCYSMEGAYVNEYAGTRGDDPDTDGDGILDGADDQDHDDVPNLMEVSRMEASHVDDREAHVDCRVDPALLTPHDVDGDGQPDEQVQRHPTQYGRIQPFNPCLPFRDSRTCPRFVEIGGTPYAPFDLSVNWVALQ